MYLSQVRAENIRALQPLVLQPDPGFNLIIGDNAAGKTSVLEAIYILSRGHSFRGSEQTEILPPQASHFQVSARSQRDGYPPESLSFYWDRKGSRVRDTVGNNMTLAEIARALPIQIIEPGSHRLVEEGPAWRRRYLDWGLFHVEPKFFPSWRRYQRALRQRNQVLRDKGPRKLVQAWDLDLAAAGEEVQTQRSSFIEQLRDRLAPYLQAMLDVGDWQLDLIRGWAADQTLAQALDAGYARDAIYGQTLHGPHRAELRLKLGSRGARHRVSRGQQKLLVSALVLAQASLVAQATHSAPILLLDDLPAELGTDFQRRLLRMLGTYPGQRFITSVELSAALTEAAPAAVFHVEHGRVERRV